ncbi:MAG: hypothetical protein IKS54_04785, partial [Erysipelotrichaceae bacterium]|nr:hypothetical protein [Erysipelotrichaceae bacterium]
MIDIHSHIIPNIDDGSDSFELSRTLLEDAVKEGITDVLITPHFMKHGPYRVRKVELLSLFEQCKEACFDLNINLYLGNELFIDRELDELLLNNEVCTMNDSNYVLIEFPFERYERDFDEYLYNVSLNYKIIIAHPERYDYVRKDPDFVKRWLNEGYYLQSNQDSLLYRDTRKVVYQLIEKGRLSFISSDCHNMHRPLSLKDAYNTISRKFNPETAELLMDINPMRVISNQKIERMPKVKRRLF